MYFERNLLSGKVRDVNANAAIEVKSRRGGDNMYGMK